MPFLDTHRKKYGSTKKRIAPDVFKNQIIIPEAAQNIVTKYKARTVNHLGFVSQALTKNRGLGQPVDDPENLEKTFKWYTMGAFEAFKLGSTHA